MTDYSLKKISKMIKGKLIGKDDVFIKHLSVDSRIATPNSLFFALIGQKNGHKYIEDAYKKNVCSFVVSNLPTRLSDFKKSNFIIVNDTLKALQTLAAHHRSKFNIPIIGITGSNGKTTVKELLFQLLCDTKRIIRSPKSYNSQIGVPLSVWLLENDYDLAIFEAGISQIGEMEKLQTIIKPDIGIFTNIGDAHQENFKDLNQKIEEKLKLFHNSKVIIYCKDYKLIDEQIKSNLNFSNVKLLSWSKKTSADLEISKIKIINNETNIKAYYQNQKIEINIPFLDNASIENVTHSWLLMLHFGYNNEYIKERMKKLINIEMKLEVKAGNNGSIIINDNHNSDLNSLKIAMDFLNQQQHTKKTLILSDILHDKINSGNLYGKVAEIIKNYDLHNFIGIGEEISKNIGFFELKKSTYKTTEEFLNNINKENFDNNAILLKGSRDFYFNKISKFLQKKTHRTVLEVDLNAIIHNLNFFRSKLKSTTKIMAMVKAFSYGSGTYEIANLLQYHKIDYLGVAYTDEGIELRKSGISLPIFVMNPEYDFETIIKYNLEPAIYNFESLEKFNNTIKTFNDKSAPIHVELDTGLNRFGFLSEEIPQLIKKLKKYNLQIKSVFSHLSATDESIHDDYTNLQIKRFEKHSTKIIKNLEKPILRHILNSAGIERFPYAQYDVVRLGIGLYGVSSVNQGKLRNISTLKSRISSIKRVHKNEPIGYGLKGKLDRDSVIALIDIGYSDGLDRHLSNGVGKVIVNEKFASIVGNIYMDVCAIDITGISANIGDEVIIFGEQYPITEIAKQLNTIPYEIMTKISTSGRIKTIYYQE